MQYATTFFLVWQNASSDNHRPNYIWLWYRIFTYQIPPPHSKSKWIFKPPSTWTHLTTIPTTKHFTTSGSYKYHNHCYQTFISNAILDNTNNHPCLLTYIVLPYLIWHQYYHQQHSWTTCPCHRWRTSFTLHTSLHHVHLHDNVYRVPCVT